jgi:hypothetical protein
MRKFTLNSQMVSGIKKTLCSLSKHYMALGDLRDYGNSSLEDGLLLKDSNKFPTTHAYIKAIDLSLYSLSMIL